MDLGQLWRPVPSDQLKMQRTRGKKAEVWQVQVTLKTTRPHNRPWVGAERSQGSHKPPWKGELPGPLRPPLKPQATSLPNAFLAEESASEAQDQAAETSQWQDDGVTRRLRSPSKWSEAPMPWPPPWHTLQAHRTGVSRAPKHTQAA